MLICHKFDVSSRAAVLQSMSYVNIIMSYMHQLACNNRQYCHASVVRGLCRWAPHPVLSIISGLSSTTTLQRGITTTTVGRRMSYPWKLHACRTNNNFPYNFFLIFWSMYLVLFSIVLYRTIVSVYTDNIFIYNYLWQMHQIINLSPVGCFTPTRGKPGKKIAR